MGAIAVKLKKEKVANDKKFLLAEIIIGLAATLNFIQYFSFLEPDFPHWLEEYINTEELLSQSYISTTCGTIYSNLFESDYFFSSLDHSVAVALIVWHFTHDKRQTLAGLFHDIATPAFKHCVDFLNKDYMEQESTEALTTEIIKNSKKHNVAIKAR